ncbi:hypothetical protein EUGRSUZ_E01895 [Eucalyptus grandis]|uniref:Uncharacterized protein n=2 Tax=Eucalyptus grandis TaxID=71139 RepID=A0ACC3KV79_EUCGR|nr:hypothetical protein EUGRSUZ_E01895 [Eucalyptus grandis]
MPRRRRPANWLFKSQESDRFGFTWSSLVNFISFSSWEYFYFGGLLQLGFLFFIWKLTRQREILSLSIYNFAYEIKNPPRNPWVQCQPPEKSY